MLLATFSPLADSLSASTATTTPNATTNAGTMSSHRMLLTIDCQNSLSAEDRLVVLQPDVGGAVGVGERVVDRLERRVDEHEPDEQETRQDERVGDDALGQSSRQALDEHVEEVEEQRGAAHSPMIARMPMTNLLPNFSG